MKNTDISERIYKILELQQVNRSAFAKGLGYSRAQGIYDILNGKSKPSFDFFERFINSEYSVNINTNWLITGKGEMLLENTNPPTETLNGVQDNKFDISPEAEINRTEFKAAQENVEWYKNLVDKQQNTIDEGLALQKSMFAELQESKVRIEKLVEIINTYKNTEKGNDLV